MSACVLLITGGNTGLGLEVVRTLYKSSKPYTILLGTRTLSNGKTAAEEIEREEIGHPSTEVTPIQIDIQNDASIDAAYDFVKSKYGRLDTLINNAGAAYDLEFTEGRITLREAWNRAYDLNTTCTHLMTLKFAPLLLESADPRLLFISSGTSSLTGQTNQRIPMDQPPPRGWPKEKLSLFGGYRSSKTGMNMMMREWARIFHHDGVKVWGVSPGLLATGLGGISPETLKKMGAAEPSAGATVIRDVVEGKRDDEAGRVVNKDGVQPW